MSRQLYQGMQRIKSSEFWRIISSSLSIILSVSLVSSNMFSIAKIIILSILGILNSILGIAILILKISGWGTLCKVKKFYCWTRSALLIFPIISIIIAVIGVSSMFIFNTSYLTKDILWLRKSMSSILLITTILFVIGYIFEAVSLFDISNIYRNVLLKIGSLIYLGSLVISPFFIKVKDYGLIYSVIENVLQIFTSLAIYLGLSHIQKTIIYNQHYASQG